MDGMLVPCDGLPVILNFHRIRGMYSRRRVSRRQPVIAASATMLLTLLACGCTTLRRQKAATESIAACRQLSRDGVAALERGDAARAQSLLEEAVAAGPSDVDARRQLAEVLWQNGARQEAVVHMEAAVRLEPRHAPTLVRSGEMLLSLGASERALERAERALGFDAALSAAWALRARVYRQRGDLERALADFQQALRFNPHEPNVLLEIAELQYQLGRPQRALTTLQRLLDSYPSGEAPRRVLWLEGLAYGSLDRKQDAVASLYAASLQGPPQPELLYQLARAQQAAGDPAGAAATVRKALAADGAHEPSRALLAQLERADGEAPLRR